MRGRLAAVAGGEGGDSGDAGDSGDSGTGLEVAGRAYQALAESPCLVVAATLEDALEVEERPNMPGTVDEWPNWSLALPAPLEEIERDPRPAALASILRRSRPG